MERKFFPDNPDIQKPVVEEKKIKELSWNGKICNILGNPKVNNVDESIIELYSKLNETINIVNNQK